jgi:hypothetical protein
VNGLIKSTQFQNIRLVSSHLLTLCIPACADFSTLKMEAILSSETSVNPGSTQRHIPEDFFKGKVILVLNYLSTTICRRMGEWIKKEMHTA